MQGLTGRNGMRPSKGFIRRRKTMTDDVSRRRFLNMAGMTVAAAGAIGASSTQGILAEGNPEAVKGKLKILGVSCSYRKGKTTAAAMQICLDEAKTVSNRIDTELIDIADLKIPGQVAAGIPLAEGERDDFPALVPKFLEPEVVGIVIGTPVYFGDMTSHCKAFLERWMVFREKGFALSGKVGAVLTVGGSRNGGQELTLQTVQAILMAQEMLIIGEGRPSAHWGATLWSKDGQITSDEFGITLAKNLGKRVAEVVMAIHGA
jgi:multimeric flavodoxin WrbA